MTEAVFAVRSERPGDEDAVDIVNCRGFGRMSEAHLVRNIREYCPTFDRRYSVVALAAEAPGAKCDRTASNARPPIMCACVLYPPSTLPSWGLSCQMMFRAFSSSVPPYASLVPTRMLHVPVE